MKTPMWKCVVVGAWMLAAMGSPWAISSAYPQESPPPSQQAKEVVALVEQAAALVNARGKAGFAEMKQNAGQWRKGDLYLFSGDMNGVSLFHMGNPKLEGTDTNNFKDSTGKSIVQEQIALIQSKGSGWVHYTWPKAGQTQPLPKWTYIKAIKVDGTPAYIGAGFYPE